MCRAYLSRHQTYPVFAGANENVATENHAQDREQAADQPPIDEIVPIDENAGAPAENHAQDREQAADEFDEIVMVPGNQIDVAYHVELPNDIDATVREVVDHQFAVDLQLAFRIEFDDQLPVKRKKRDPSQRKKRQTSRLNYVGCIGCGKRDQVNELPMAVGIDYVCEQCAFQ